MMTLKHSRWLVALIAVALVGCVEVQQALLGTAGSQDVGEPADETPVDGALAPESVHLSADNSLPGLGETVRLTCRVTKGSSVGVTFDFAPDDGRLYINHAAGTAWFIVDETDLGFLLSLACTASNEHGTSDASNVVTINPTR